MLTWQELVELERGLPPTRVLSVYVDGTARDPAERTAWRRAVRGATTRLRESLLAAPHDEREALDKCLAQLELALGPEGTALGSAGWMGFFSPDAAPRTERLPVTVPTLVAWERGFRIAPSLGATIGHAVAALALVDARVARIYRLTGDALALVEVQRAIAHVEPPAHMGAPPRLGFHSGTRGTAGTDQSQRELRAGTEAMLRLTARRLEELAGRDGWFLLGGIGEVTAELERTLPERLRERVHRVAGVDMHANDVQLAAMAAAERAVAEHATSLHRVQELLDRGAAGGKGAIGLEAVREALRERAVDRLVVTGRFLVDHAAESERMLRAVHDQSAVVELVSGAAAARLDADAGGIGARLRFAPPRVQPPVGAVFESTEELQS